MTAVEVSAAQHAQQGETPHGGADRIGGHGHELEGVVHVEVDEHADEVLGGAGGQGTSPHDHHMRGGGAEAFKTVRQPLGARTRERATAEPTVEQLLDFEATTPNHSGWKDEAIRVELGVKPARYYVLLQRAATSPAGLVHDPITCRRITGRISDHDRRMTR